ncbi:extracellular solute-binding protein [Luedemannella flava]|uniref:Extracellular solute-binding protein n=1 Tax=Luedemannella flava TaxID=349316 RepID=A0ABN2M0P8_9ACTN
MKRRTLGVGLLALAVAATAACGDDAAEQPNGNAITGEITVLTQRTDLVDNVFVEYKKKFEAKYPGTSVKFEAITDYEGEVRIRMNTDDYGDVLLIPNSVTANQLPTFFEPLGTVDELGAKYRFVNEQAYQGKVYGLAITGNAQGFVYNKKVWAAAGVTTPPKTPQEFLTALTAIKDRTDAIPLYTNYKDGWPLTQWEGVRGGVSGDAEAVNKLGADTAPWAEGKEHNLIDSLLYNAVNQKLTEDDPTTTNWENSKKLIGTGKVATMMLGSWSIVQMQAAATDKADIGYLPFPNQAGGKFHSAIGGDYKNAINIHSKNKATARAWIDWFANESNYATDQGGIAPVKSAEFPATLADFKTAGVELVELAPAPAGKEALVGNIDKAAEIGLWDPKYRQRIVDAARGAKKETLQQIFDDLNKRWADAQAKAS